MPYRVELLDSSYVDEENIVIVLGRNIILKIIENPTVKALLDDQKIKTFVSIKDLCEENTRSLINDLITQEAYLTAPSIVQEIIEEKEKHPNFEQRVKALTRITQPLTQSKFAKKVESRLSKTLKDDLSSEELRRDLMFRLKGEVDERKIQKHVRRLLAIQKEITERTGLRMMVRSTLLVCPHCNVVLFPHEVTDSLAECFVCNKTIKEEKLKSVPIYRIHEKIRKVWHRNLWFEAHFAGLLRKLDFRTWIGVHVMGASGIPHEVDILAIKNGMVVICECKTGKVSRNNVFNFCTKVSDLKGHVSILALIKELPEPETREFLRKNQAIITLENMGKMKEKAILTELNSKLPEIS
jgi:hypothetical protein